MENTEFWIPIVGYENNYEVSNLGRVRSLHRFLKLPNGGFKEMNPIFLAGGNSGKGYRILQLYKNGVFERISFHRLVAKSFIPNPENKPQVNHKNGIKHDNRVENLEWCTAKENMQHARRTNLNPILSGSKLPHSKLNEIQVLEIRNSTKGNTELGLIYGLKDNTICDIRKRRTWKHI